MAVAWAVLKLKTGASESNPHPRHPVVGSEKKPALSNWTVQYVVLGPAIPRSGRFYFAI